MAAAGGRQRVYDALKKHCRGFPEYYLVEEHREFKMLADSMASRAYFVDTDDSGRRAIPIRDPAVSMFSQRADREEFRLYAPGSAVQELAALLS